MNLSGTIPIDILFFKERTYVLVIYLFPSSAKYRSILNKSPTKCNSMQSDLFHCILLHLVGLLFNINYDERNHELKKYTSISTYKG